MIETLHECLLYSKNNKKNDGVRIDAGARSEGKYYPI